MESVTNVFAPPSRSGTRTRPLHLGSVKANVGHGEAASGVTAFVKSLLMFQHNTIPPHCGIKGTINQGFPKDFSTRNVHIAFKPTPFHSKDDSPRRIFINNFSAAGGNTATLLEEPPSKPTLRDDPRGEWPIVVSAKSKSALRANTKNLVKYIEEHPDVRMSDLSYTTTARRIQHQYRIAISCDSDVDKAAELLSSKLETEVSPVATVQPTVAFAYTGQGSQYYALGKNLYRNTESFKDDLQNLNDISAGLGYPSFLPLVEGTDALGNAVEVKELSPLVVQLGLLSIQIGLSRLWSSLGVKPDAVLGHSLGEYAALNAAGVLSISDTIYLVGERAKLLQEKCTPGSHAMLATRSSAASIEGILKEAEGVEVACYNGPEETVVGGPLAAINDLAETLSLQGIKSTKLRTPFAFHTSQVDPILDDFRQLAESVTFHKPQVPVISPLLSSVLTEQNIDSSYLARHARESVNFVGGLTCAEEEGLISKETSWVELGPHPVCIGFLKSTFGPDLHTAPSLRRDVNPYKTLAESVSMLHLAGTSINWNQYHSDFTDCVRLLDLPAYAFDNKKYWIDYVGDWNLTKGQIVESQPHPEPRTSVTTTSVQNIVSKEVNGEKATVIIESDTSQPQLKAAVQGHMVNGTALCPSSLYADMAMTVAQHLHKLLFPDSEAVLPDVSDMEVFKPFIVEDDPSKSKTLRLSGTLMATDRQATLVFSSGNGKGEVQHAKCTVRYGSSQDWSAKFKRQTYLIGERIDRLRQLESSGHAHRMLRGMAYKVFGAFVDYDDKYRGMEDVILDSPELEATANISFQTKDSDGDFYCSPYWIDSVCHLAGFIVNANDTIDSGKQVYVSHGWESMRFAEPLQSHKKYRSYVKMQPLDDNVVAGDVYIFHEDRIVGLCEQLKFQCIPRSLLNTFLPPKGAVAPKIATQTAKTALQVNGTKTTKATKATTKPAIKPASSITSQVLGIIAAEVGVPLEELADAIDFPNLGVDSLMSLTISARVREVKDIDFPQTVFADYATVGELKGWLRQFEERGTSESSDDSESATTSIDTDDSLSDASTPLSVPNTPVDDSDLAVVIRKTISEGMEVDLDELVSIEDLSTIGMDSLMALTLLGTLREKTGLALGSDFFVDNRNIKSIEQALHISPPEAEPKVRSTKANHHSSPKTPPSDVQSTVVANTPLQIPKTQKVSLPDRQATSLLLQGNPKSATKTFWLVPDGGGAPTSYTGFDTISPTLAIYALTSPFVKTPEEFIIGVPGIAAKYVTEIRRRQPSGPYHIGGWSAGGVISYEIARQLITQHDATVDTLVLIDTPCPLIIEPLPSSLHRFFGSIGLLGEGDGALDRLPPWLLPHFASSVTALATYDAVPLPEGKSPSVWAIWCEDGVCKEDDDPRPEPYPYGHAQWLLENRSDFGPNLWDEFVDKEKIITDHMEGNHFSMMKAPYVGKLTDFVRRALV